MKRVFTVGLAGVFLSLECFSAGFPIDFPSNLPSTFPSGFPSSLPSTFPSAFPSAIPTHESDHYLPNSYDAKILKAVESKLITSDQGWVYRIQARFEPALVPEAYRPEPVSVSSNESNPQTVNAAIEALPGLSLEAQLTLIPYLVPPSSPEHFSNRSKLKSMFFNGISKKRREDLHLEKMSTSESQIALSQEAGCLGTTPIPEPFPQGSWVFVDDTFFRFWYQYSPETEELHQRLINLGKQTLYHAKNVFQDLMHHSIIDDSGEHSFVAKDGSTHVWCNGGNGKLDIYLGKLTSGRGITITYPVGCSQKASFVVIDEHRPSYDDRFYEFALAHELMHVFQYTKERALSCDQYVDADEGIADWAAHFAFPDNNTEHEHDYFSKVPELSFLNRAYDTWPFYLWLVQKQGSQIISKIYDSEAGLNPYRAMDVALPGNWKKNWPEFSAIAWNNTTLPSFKEWDHFDAVPVDPKTGEPSKEQIALDSRGEFYKEFAFDLPMGLTREYEHLLLDGRARSVTLNWTRSGIDKEHYHVRALIKKKGEWKVENWDPTEPVKNPFQRKLCFDQPDAGHIDEIVLVFSRSDIEPPFGAWSDPAHITLKVGSNNIPCDSIQGTANASTKEESGIAGSGNYNLLRMVSNYNASFQSKKDTENQPTSKWNAIQASGDYTFEGRVESNDPCAAFQKMGIENFLCKISPDFLTRFGFEVPGFKSLQFGQIDVCTANLVGPISVDLTGSSVSVNPFTEASNNLRNYSIFLRSEEPSQSQVNYQCTSGASYSANLIKLPIMGFTNTVVTPEGKLNSQPDSTTDHTMSWSFAPSDSKN